jgi:hypothetical protein
MIGWKKLKKILDSRNSLIQAFMLIQADYSTIMHWKYMLDTLNMFIDYYHMQNLTFVGKMITKRY